MEFFTQAVNVLKILVMAVGAGLGAWGVINLMEGYGNDNPGGLLLFKKEICFICMYLWGQRSGVVKLPIRLVLGKTRWEINP